MLVIGSAFLLVFLFFVTGFSMFLLLLLAVSIGAGDDGALTMFSFSAYDKIINFPGVPSIVLANEKIRQTLPRTYNNKPK